MRALYIRDVSFDDMDRGTFASRLYDDIDKKLWEVCGELNESGVNGTCLIFVQRVLKVWPGTVKYFNEGIREQIAKILQNAQGTIEKGTAIWVQINEIIQLLLTPQFATVCNDILDLWIESSNSTSGRLEVQAVKKIFEDLLDVVQTLQKKPDMKSNTRLQYVVKFISDVRTVLERRTVQMTNPVSVFLYINTAMG